MKRFRSISLILAFNLALLPWTVWAVLYVFDLSPSEVREIRSLLPPPPWWPTLPWWQTLPKGGMGCGGRGGPLLHQSCRADYALMVVACIRG